MECIAEFGASLSAVITKRPRANAARTVGAFTYVFLGIGAQLSFNITNIAKEAGYGSLLGIAISCAWRPSDTRYYAETQHRRHRHRSCYRDQWSRQRLAPLARMCGGYPSLRVGAQRSQTPSLSPCSRASRCARSRRCVLLRRLQHASNACAVHHLSVSSATAATYVLSP